MAAAYITVPDYVTEAVTGCVQVTRETGAEGNGGSDSPARLPKRLTMVKKHLQNGRHSK